MVKVRKQYFIRKGAKFLTRYGVIFLFFNISIANANWVSQNVTSSFIDSIRYNTNKKELGVVIRGKIYYYCNVQEYTYEAFGASSSKGRFYNKNIKNNSNYYCY